MNMVAVVGHNNLDFIKRRIEAGHRRAEKGGAEWIEGSLEVAAGLLEGRDAMPANLAFKDWLIQNGLNFYHKNDRAALINLAADLALMRTVLTETDSTSYRLIWQQNKARFPNTGKTTTTGRKRRVTKPGRAKLFRAMKLGEDTITKIKGTSLDSAGEMDELVILNRGAPQGELTDVVRRLVDAAAAGQHVSAIAEASSMVVNAAPPNSI